MAAVDEYYWTNYERRLNDLTAPSWGQSGGTKMKELWVSTRWQRLQVFKNQMSQWIRDTRDWRSDQLTALRTLLVRTCRILKEKVLPQVCLLILPIMPFYNCKEIGLRVIEGSKVKYPQSCAQRAFSVTKDGDIYIKMAAMRQPKRLHRPLVAGCSTQTNMENYE